ncbi:hypothetical protein GIB67_027651 [Kingdonia uniflora]|uniref:Uncharacterized protein n=1 Tax=Kingdonia uniflora TaxID=39325 RepID=A0A7J7NLB2_9MAGN|nr:hypothetical protein GIB67_027651 [Kingdonia uniflora]
MHLWPSLRIRDSFKMGYLKKADWNLKRMKSEKESQTNQRLLENNNNRDGESSGSKGSKLAMVGREFLLMFTCCYCCFCCGGKPHFSIFIK